VECVNLRVSARVTRMGAGLPRAEPTGAAGPRGSQRAHFSGAGEIALAVYDRAALRPGTTIAGPATIEDEWSTTIVYPGQRCAADPFGNLVIEA
jgi:N-methylhydantoinase A